MGAVVKVPRQSGLAGRRRDAVRSLTAAGLVPTYDLLYGSQGGRFFEEQVMAAKFVELDYETWPCESGFVSAGDLLFREGGQSVHRLKDGTLVKVRRSHGGVDVTAASATRVAVLTTLLAFRDLYPATYLVAQDDGVVRVPITFWTNSAFGPQRRLRMIEAASWEAIEENYPDEVHAELATLMDTFAPGKTGQLLLWQGPPGTGKTWALRALASHWRSWAEFNYITDPDAFFVDEPIYMLDVLLSDSYEAIDEPSGDLYTANDPDGKWRVLILEDTGELLSAKAKEKYGQGLSRLLNVVDGMIGQGLRVLCLVTTNDELGELNPAVLRPGRCASQIVFRPFTGAEAEAITGTEWTADAVSLAEIYAARGDAADALVADDEETLVASADETTMLAEIARVAEQHVPESGSYGDTWWRASDATVFWNAADWSGNPEIEAAEDAFLAIDGVDRFEYDYECGPMDGDGFERVWPEPVDELAALDEVVALAQAPLLEPSDSAYVDATVREGLRTLTVAHKQTIDGVNALVSTAARPKQGRSR